MLQSKNNNRIKTFIITLSVILAVSVFALASVVAYKHFFAKPDRADVTVTNNVITPNSSNTSAGVENNADDNSTTVTDGVAVVPQQNTDKNASVVTDMLFINSSNPSVNTPFDVNNMLPGDSETMCYKIRIAHKGDVTVKFKTTVKEDYQILAQVLKCKVVLTYSGEVLYDGLMADMPESLDTPLKTNASTESDLCYEITAYLDTSVGNEYQNKALLADFVWWVDETQNLDSPHTADAPIVILIAVITALVSALVILLAVFWRRKGELANG